MCFAGIKYSHDSETNDKVETVLVPNIERVKRDVIAENIATTTQANKIYKDTSEDGLTDEFLKKEVFLNKTSAEDKVKTHNDYSFDNVGYDLLKYYFSSNHLVLRTLFRNIIPTPLSRVKITLLILTGTTAPDPTLAESRSTTCCHRATGEPPPSTSASSSHSMVTLWRT